MKAKVKAPFFNQLGLFKKGDVIDVSEKDFDASLMEPVDGSDEETTEETQEESKETDVAEE